MALGRKPSFRPNAILPELHMPNRPRETALARRERGRALLNSGRTPQEVAEESGVCLSTVYRWRGEGRRRRSSRRPKAPAGVPSVSEMLRAEGPAVARVLLDLAKQGDVRAAGLVVRLLGDSLTSEVTDDSDAEADLSDFDQELRSLPPDIAAEIVGLLAEAGRAAAVGPGSAGAAASGGRGRSRRLPWQAEDSASDEGADTL